MVDYSLYEKDHTKVNIHTWFCVLFILTLYSY